MIALILVTTGSFLCKMCQWAVESARLPFSGFLGSKLSVQICDKLKRKACQSMLKKMSSELMNRLLVRSLFDLCQAALNCPSLQQFPRQAKARTSWRKNLFLSETRIFHISDIHLDINFKQQGSSQCDLMICCRDGAGQQKIAHENCDVSLQFLKRAVESISKQSPEILIVTGDLTAHNQWQKDQELIKQTHRLVVQQLATLGAETVYVLGNNDLVFDHQYSIDRDLQVRRNFALLANISEPSFFRCGFYSKVVKNMKFIALNLQPADLTNFFSIRKFETQCRQIGWLFEQLQQAASQGTPVFLLGHLPLTDYNSYKSYAEQINNILNQFSDIIKGEFFGHSHSDYFRAQRRDWLSFVSPALSPFKTGRSYYRFYQLSKNKIQNYIQYKLTLPDHQYELDYSFIERFNSTDPQVLRGVLAKALHSEQLARLFQSGPLKQADGKFKSSCKLLDSTSQIQKCLGPDFWHSILHLIKLYN